MSNIIPTNVSPSLPATRQVRPPTRTSRALARLEHSAIVRSAAVQAEGYVQMVKVQELDGLTREALTGQAMLAKWRDTLAGSDVMLADELRLLTDIARLGKGEIIAETVSTFCRER
jgi:hypothetical protein